MFSIDFSSIYLSIFKLGSSEESIHDIDRTYDSPPLPAQSRWMECQKMCDRIENLEKALQLLSQSIEEHVQQIEQLESENATLRIELQRMQEKIDQSDNTIEALSQMSDIHDQQIEHLKAKNATFRRELEKRKRKSSGCKKHRLFEETKVVNLGSICTTRFHGFFKLPNKINEIFVCGNVYLFFHVFYFQITVLRNSSDPTILIAQVLSQNSSTSIRNL